MSGFVHEGPLSAMTLAAALIYWAIIALWLAVFTAISVAYIRNPRTFGTVRLLLSVLVIDTTRNIAENLYFGIYFGGQYGLLPSSLVSVLGNPSYLIIPKVLNVIAALAVLGLLVFRWLPLAAKERAKADADFRLQADALSQETRERQRLFDTSLDLIVVTDPNGTFVRVSPSSFAIVGYRPEDMIGRNGTDFIYPEDWESIRREMKLGRLSGQGTRNFDTRYVHKNGTIISLAWSGVWSEPEQKYFLIGRDVTERKIAEEKLRRLAHYDQLTGLPNRTSLNKDLEEVFVDLDTRSVSIAIFDLDGFKDINDTLGHTIGDKLLQMVADREAAAAAGRRVYRLGGDEFVLTLPDCGDPLVAMQAVKAIFSRLTECFEVEGHRLFVAASAGVAVAPAHGATIDELVANADLALYDAKNAGGQMPRLFIPTLRAKASARRELDGELRRACANHEFVLHFQPQVRSSDKAIVGAEALLRWQHPDKGLLAPAAFIDVLSESAVALEVSRWILASACKVAASWRKPGRSGLRIGVNLFAVQFRRGTLLNDVEVALSESGLPPDALELEVTENIALRNDEAIIGSLQQLRAKGIGIAFDDFGTGYASLSSLTRFPLTRIKIDRGFVANIAGQSGAEDAAIVRSIIAMARNLKLEVTAEGVETAAQEAFLAAEGCDELQGFRFSKPLPAKTFEIFASSYPEMTTEGWATGAAT
ncbi:EAL domain-containing protein [Bradyrhizobium sp. ISRA463]|uniref:putative bifunctional diguanylate cyclase/phosphodiesterase n=1 Tax=Bradyrhizobium sp. ISRA463 TaxID=2866199 RepID=UPI00247AB6DE|nr:EAL domain-containing protein [Bradyrhizobium sp. ISRA463]WGS21745.1 EAL domain-containing protein [Bradyrhizobium sp. ISRA463]